MFLPNDADDVNDEATQRLLDHDTTDAGHVGLGGGGGLPQNELVVFDAELGRNAMKVGIDFSTNWIAIVTSAQKSGDRAHVQAAIDSVERMISTERAAERDDARDDALLQVSLSAKTSASNHEITKSLTRQVSHNASGIRFCRTSGDSMSCVTLADCVCLFLVRFFTELYR